MGKNSGITWCDHTFNPWWGCVKVSEGCKRCYAETWAKRMGLDVFGPRKERRFFGEAHWNEPLKWNRDAAANGSQARVFCASMADVFEDDRGDLVEPRLKLWKLMGETPNLDWLVLTKRPERIKWNAPQEWIGRGGPDNIFMGTTIENQAVAKQRIADLLRWPGRNFISVEPMLEPVSIARAMQPEDEDWQMVDAIPDVSEPEEFEEECEVECDWVNFGNDLVENPEWREWKRWRLYRAQLFAMGRLIDWVIVGGESGHGARAMELWWAHDLVYECGLAGVPVFVKQLGGWPDKRDQVELWPEQLRKQEFPRTGEYWR
jgi:protein gp37